MQYSCKIFLIRKSLEEFKIISFILFSSNESSFLSVFGIVYASCIAIVQKDYKRLIAYSSIAHVGLISAGILSANQQGIQGALMQMLAHGVSVIGLFFIADILLRHTGTRDIHKLGGIRSMNGNFAEQTQALYVQIRQRKPHRANFVLRHLCADCSSITQDFSSSTKIGDKFFVRLKPFSLF